MVLGKLVNHVQKNEPSNEVPSHAGQNGYYQNSTKINYGDSVEKRESSYIVGGTTN